MPAVREDASAGLDSQRVVGRTGNRYSGAPLIFVAIFACCIVSHFSLLRLPYLWDEAGYYVPAARDLLLGGSLVPRSTLSNAHPPIVMGWLALWWKVFGFAPLVTRTAMLVITAFTLWGVLRLASLVANLDVAVAATVCTGLYSVFFTQSSLAHLDLAAAGFTLWGLHSYCEDRRVRTVVWFSLAALAKETAILAPLALLAWEFVRPILHKRFAALSVASGPRSFPLHLFLCLLPLSGWFAYHYVRTGYLLGNQEYFRYNVASTLHPVRIVLAIGMRLWQLFGYLNMWLLTAATLLAMLLPAQETSGEVRPRISLPVQMVFYVLMAAYVISMGVIGGAVLARYLLPVYPLWIIVCVSTLWRRVRYWPAVVVVAVIGFVMALMVNPPYGFAFEDNLAYRDYIRLHQDAEVFLEARYPMARVLTAWPASDELTRPYLGYLSRPMRVVRIDNFSFEQLSAASDLRDQYDVALAFSTKYLPPRSLLARWPAWERVQTRYFGFHRDLPPAAAAQLLGGEVVYTESRNGQWIGIIRLERVVEARAPGPRTSAPANDRNAFSRSATQYSPAATQAHRVRPG